MAENNGNGAAGVRSEAVAWELLEKAINKNGLKKHLKRLREKSVMTVSLAAEASELYREGRTIGETEALLKKLDPVFKDMDIWKALTEGHLVRYLMRTLPVGQSRYGGYPDLPEGVEWPKTKDGKMVFVMQVNLGEIPDFEGNLLPKSGRLYFFHGNNDPSLDEVKVIYWEDMNTPLVRQAEPAAKEMCNSRHFNKVAFAYGVRPLDMNWLQAKVGAGATDGLDDDEVDEVSYALEDMRMEWDSIKPYASRGEALGHLLGPVSDSGTLDYMLKDSGRRETDWIPLAVLYSTAGNQWGDEPLVIAIRKSDLEARKFSDLYAFPD